MGVKKAVNRALGVAGVQLVRSTTLADQERVRTELRSETKRLGRELTMSGRQTKAAEKQTKAAEKVAASQTTLAEAAVAEQEKLRRAARRRRAIPADFHPDMREIWPAVKPRTMVGLEKLNFFCDAARYVSTVGLEGAIVECGVWRGGAMLGCAMVLDSLGDHSRDLYLFDTYAGMSEPTEKDVHLWHGRTAEEFLEAKANPGAPIWEVGQIEDVRAAFDETTYPKDRLHFIKGKVEDTIPGEAPQQICILRLDTDWYESTKHELVHLYDRLVPGGVLIIDDYGSWAGSKEATDEFFAELSAPPMLTRVGRGRNAIKPGTWIKSSAPDADQAT